MSSQFEKGDLNDSWTTCVERSEIFQNAIKGASVKVAESSRLLCDDSNLFREMALALLIRTMLCKQGEKGHPSPSISSRISLITSFVQGANCTKNLVLGGYHAKAAAVLKQDYEILTRIKEVKAGKSKDGVTPNVKHAPEGSQRIYGALNDFAHPSNEALIIRHLQQAGSDGIPGVSPFPTFVKRTIEVHWWTHVWLTHEFCKEALQLLAENYGEEDLNVQDCYERWENVVEEGIRCGLLILKTREATDSHS